MRKRYRKQWLLLALLGLLCRPGPASAAPRRAMEGDPRGSMAITVQESGDHLGAILERVSEQTGVTLETETPMADTVLVCHYQGMLSGFLDALASFFAVDREHRPRWVRSGPAGKKRFRLERDLATVELIERLRRDRESELVQRMEGLLRVPTMTEEAWQNLSHQDPKLYAALKSAREYATHSPELRQFAELSPDLRRKVYSGGSLTLPLASLAGGRSGTQQMRDLVGADAASWSGQGRITYSMAGPAPLQRSFSWTISGDPAHPGSGMGAATCIVQVFPDLAPEKQIAEWRERYGDPAPRDSGHVKFLAPDDPPLDMMHRRDILMRIAHRASVNLIADEAGRSLEANFFPATGTVAELLDQACRLTPRAGDWETENHGSFWRKAGDCYLVRSLSWPEEEVRLIPYRWLKAWQESEKKHGHLTAEDICEMAALHPQQLVQLGLWYPQAEKIMQAQAPLRWYSRASASLKARLGKPPGLPLPLIGIDSQELIPDVDPRHPSPDYVKFIQLFGAERVNFSVTVGRVKHGGIWYNNVLGIVFAEYRGEKQPRRSWTATIPLTREMPPPPKPSSEPPRGPHRRP
jgi:hypothetical protein